MIPCATTGGKKNQSMADGDSTSRGGDGGPEIFPRPSICPRRSEEEEDWMGLIQWSEF